MTDVRSEALDEARAGCFATSAGVGADAAVRERLCPALALVGGQCAGSAARGQEGAAQVGVVGPRLAAHLGVELAPDRAGEVEGQLDEIGLLLTAHARRTYHGNYQRFKSPSN